MNTSPQVSNSGSAETTPSSVETILLRGRELAPAPQIRSLRVLCIDDDEQFLELMNDCLTHFKHEVRVASGGKYGFELFCTAMMKSQPYDVVIVDLCMPDLDGYEVARMIKAESHHTPVILMTGERQSRQADGEAASAVDAVVGKPPHIQELNALLLRAAG